MYINSAFSKVIFLNLMAVPSMPGAQQTPSFLVVWTMVVKVSFVFVPFSLLHDNFLKNTLKG